MSTRKFYLLVVLLVLAALTVGCGRAETPPPASPTPDLQATNQALQATIQALFATATPSPAPTPTPAARVIIVTATPPEASDDPVITSLRLLGFNSRKELIDFFQMEGVEPREISTCPGEIACVRIVREKNQDGFIEPFRMTNPTGAVFDGWRAASQPFVSKWDGSQAKVPPGGPWLVEGVTIRPWQR